MRCDFCCPWWQKAEITWLSMNEDTVFQRLTNEGRWLSSGMRFHVICSVLFRPDDWGSIFLQNIRKYLRKYTSQKTGIYEVTSIRTQDLINEKQYFWTVMFKVLVQNNSIKNIKLHSTESKRSILSEIWYFIFVLWGSETYLEAWSLRKFKENCWISVKTNNGILTLTLVSLYSCGRTESSKSRTSEGLLCAAELKATRATRRTFRSGSCRVLRNSPILCRRSGSIGWG